MPSVVIAAHNEASVIGRCLDALMRQDAGKDPLDITVAANGCTDGTAQIARQRGVRVVEVEEASKAIALNVGDAAARGFPRIYLDADIEVPQGAIIAFVQALGAARPLAAVPRRRVDVAGRPRAVKAYLAINSRLPAFQNGLVGRGMIALSERGRERFDAFPIMLADDLFLDSLFSPAEKTIVDSVEVSIAAPWRTSELIRRLVRVRRANAEMRAVGSAGKVTTSVRSADRLAWLKTVVLPNPQLAPVGVVYATISVLVALLARRRPRPGKEWARDDTTRRVLAGMSERAWTTKP
jgi:glycosyltransferase involved in cell wall biosynthesis